MSVSVRIYSSFSVRFGLDFSVSVFMPRPISRNSILLVNLHLYHSHDYLTFLPSPFPAKKSVKLCSEGKLREIERETLPSSTNTSTIFTLLPAVRHFPALRSSLSPVNTRSSSFLRFFKYPWLMFQIIREKQLWISVFVWISLMICNLDLVLIEYTLIFSFVVYNLLWFWLVLLIIREKQIRIMICGVDSVCRSLSVYGRLGYGIGVIELDYGICC